METRISQRPSRAPGRRSKAPGGRKSSHAPPKPGDVRAFGRALDLLVRAIRASAPNLEQVSQRALAAWSSLNLAPLEIDAVEARVRNVSVTSAEQEIRWLLPAFMAGLRRVAPHPELSEPELRSFAEALSHIDPNVASIEEFREWIWSGSATGFELELQSSFMEALDDAAMEREVEVGSALEQIRAATLRAASDRAALLSSRALARVAEREELDLPLCAPDTRANEAALVLPADVAARLKAECEDTAVWVAAEVRLVTSQAALADTVRVDKFAKRVHEALRLSPPSAVSAVEALAQRARLRDPFAMDLLQTLDDAEFGRGLGEALWQDPARARRGADVVLGLGPAAADAALGVLVERASADPAWVQGLKTVVVAAGGRLDAALLSRPEVPTAGGVRAFAEVFGLAGIQTLWARAMREGGPWLGRTFATLCRALLDAGAGDTLVQAARDRDVSVALREEILDVLGADPARLAQAVAWRMAELLEPPALRERLKTLRANA